MFIIDITGSICYAVNTETTQRGKETTMKATIARSTIALLNQKMRSHQRKNPTWNDHDAGTQAAHDLGLVEVKRDESTILYRNKQRAYVTLWFDYCIETGFDDQIDWAFNTDS